MAKGDYAHTQTQLGIHSFCHGQGTPDFALSIRFRLLMVCPHWPHLIPGHAHQDRGTAVRVPILKPLVHEASAVHVCIYARMRAYTYVRTRLCECIRMLYTYPFMGSDDTSCWVVRTPRNDKCTTSAVLKLLMICKLSRTSSTLTLNWLRLRQ